MVEAGGFLLRHEFLIRRLHSLSGLIPVGAFMTMHLFANASILNGVSSFQNVVYLIHSLGRAVPVVEWLFIFLPILFHAAIGFVFIFGMKNNTNHYSYQGNYRYLMQRITGMIAFVFILYHVLHMNGVIQFEWVRDKVLDPIGLAQFRPYNAASTAARAMQSPIITALYSIGMLSCVYHFANGLWTMGITWGVWVSPRAQKWASHVCLSFGHCWRPSVLVPSSVYGRLMFHRLNNVKWKYISNGSKTDQLSRININWFVTKTKKRLSIRLD